MDEVERIAAITDPWDRLTHAHQLAVLLSGTITDVSRLRREVIEDLINGPDRARPSDIAKLMGISVQRLWQLRRSGPRPERSFLGSGNTITVLFGGKREADKSPGNEPGPAVSADDMRGFDLLVRAGKDLGFEVEYEVVEPPGFVDLSRDSLVVACGPRLSPMIEQAVNADPNIDFTKDDQGWHLVDRATGTTYRSPMDDGVHADYGYVARLPRMDGKGSYLYSAGIHAPGVTGGLHYVVNNLAEMYSEVKTARFSCIVRCEFDEHTREISASERVTDLYRHT